MSQSSFGRRHPRAASAALSIAFLIVALAGLEWLAGRLVERGDAFQTDMPDDWTHTDVTGVERALPERSFRIVQEVRATGEPVFDITLTTDAIGRRRVPLDDPAPREHFILFFGGSYVLGWGVEDDETLPAQLARRAPDWMPYNYGFHLHGPGEMLAKLDSGTLRDELGERDGILLYIYTGSDRDRAIGSMRIVSAPRGAAKPYYRLSEGGGVAWAGTFESGRPVRTGWYRLLGASSLLRLARVELRPGSAEEQVGLVAAMLDGARERFLEQFPGSRFVVMIFPDNRRAEPLVEALRGRDVEVLDWTVTDGVPDGWTLPGGDRHPSAEANAALAERLVAELGLAPGSRASAAGG